MTTSSVKTAFAKNTAGSENWVIGNWKLNPASQQAATALIKHIVLPVAQMPHCQVMLAPSFVHLPVAAATLASIFDDTAAAVHDLPKVAVEANDLSFNKDLRFNKVTLVGQDVTALTEATGAYTGDVSALQLKDIGVEWVILGHSERRQYHAEDNAKLVAKVKHCAKHDLGVIFCIGESESAFMAGETEAILIEQLQVIASFVQTLPTSIINKGKESTAVQDASKQEKPKQEKPKQEKPKQKSAIAAKLARFIIAYEPVWAIGTGKVASVEQVEAVHRFIRQQLIGFDSRLSQTPIIYGGSVNADNAPDFAASPAIDGVLVGGAALQAESFISIVNSFACQGQ